MESKNAKTYYLFIIDVAQKKAHLRASSVNIIDLYRITTEWYLNFEDEYLRRHPDIEKTTNLEDLSLDAFSIILKMWYISQDKDFEPDEDFFEMYKKARTVTPKIIWNIEKEE